MAATSTSFRIALRFLTARKRAMMMSLACIVLGVGLFIITQATTSGFEELFVRSVLGTNGAIRIEDKIQDMEGAVAVSGAGAEASSFQVSNLAGRKFIHGIEEPEQMIAALSKFQNVSGVSAVLSGYTQVLTSFNRTNGQIFGVVLDEHLRVSDLAQQIVEGSLQDFRETPDGVLMGRAMAEWLRLSPGDSLILQAGSESGRFRLCGIYETGITDIDKSRVYLHLPEARALLRQPTGASFLQLGLRDRDRAKEDAYFMSLSLGHVAVSWQQRERSWLEVFRALRLTSGLTVLLFGLIAGLAMFNTLAMIVIDKTRDIAILRAMGYTQGDITAIFLWQSALVLAVGLVGGCLLGAGGTWAISAVPVRIRGIFATDNFIVTWAVWHYVQAVLMAAGMVLVASLLPARRAARLEPGQVMRGAGAQ